MSKNKEFVLVYKVVFFLSRGQSLVERDFSVKKIILAGNIGNKSIVSRRIIEDWVKTTYYWHLNKLTLDV